MALTTLLTVTLRGDGDVLAARRHARYIAELLGLEAADQVRIAALTFELAHELFRHTLTATLALAVETAPPTLQITLHARGDGVPSWQVILHERAGGEDLQPLLADFTIDLISNHAAIAVLRKPLALSGAIADERARAIVELLTEAPQIDPFAEIVQQNRELTESLGALQTRQEQLRDLNRELEDTNRGVVALYAELDEKAVELRQADAMKTRFLSNMSHEFRTPLGSIRALAQILLQRLDGELTAEQEKQVALIQGAAAELTDLVNDLLDLAKIEAGRVDIRPGMVSIRELFSALRGMLGPLLQNDQVALDFHCEDELESLYTDETKLSQILRNFISNALKFTQIGSIDVRARRSIQNHEIEFSVSDTGIGIAKNDMELIFEEFTQVENNLQQYVKGTGLGLPLCRQLAALLQGRIDVQSTPGEGSTFTLILPERYMPPATVSPAHQTQQNARAGLSPPAAPAP